MSGNIDDFIDLKILPEEDRPLISTPGGDTHNEGVGTI